MSGSPAAARSGCSSSGWTADPMKLAFIEKLRQAREAGDPVALVTELSSGRQTPVYPAAVTGDFALEGDRLARIRQAVQDDRSGILDQDYFVQVVSPARRLIVVG